MTPQRSRYGDYIGAVMLVTLGAAIAIVGSGYGVGTLTTMGPGFIPTGLGVSLAIVGVLLGLTAAPDAPKKAHPVNEARQSLSVIDWRAWVCIIGGVGAFILLGEHTGFVPASFVSVFICALGDRKNSVRDAALLAAVLVLTGYIIFIWGLKLQFEPFMWG